MRRLIYLCLALMVFGGGAWAAANPPPMVVPSQFNVSSTGAATYSIPIAVPPGSAGMIPMLSLDYSSQSGDGFEGMGWSLGGLPSIMRCPRTIAQDGTHGSVNYDADDKLCMGGQRLIYVSGGSGYGKDGALYHTEIESFSKVVEHHDIDDSVSKPWFEVWTKAGQHIEFGNTSDSQVLVSDGSVSLSAVRFWAANKISDTVGNYFTITYNSAAGPERIQNGEAYPLRVDYTGNASAGVSPYNSVQFTYTSRADSVALYHAGGLTRTSHILTNIQTYQAANLVSDYRLDYRAGTLGATVTHSRITSITFCDGSRLCYPATSFGWQGGEPGLNMGSAAPFGQQAGKSALPGDWNGDGITDEVVLPSGCPPYDVYLGPSFLGPPSYTLTNGATSASICILDVADTPLSPNGATSFALEIHGGFVPLPHDRFFYTFFTSRGSLNIGPYPTYSTASIGPHAGDYNGDGLPDFYEGDDSNIWLGDTSVPTVFTADGGGHLSGANLAADFDGDGCTDLYKTSGPTLDYAYYCNPAVSSASSGNLPTISPFSAITEGDFNGDGKTDMLVRSTAGGGANLYISTGIGFVQSSFSVPSTWTYTDYLISVGDWNGDGKADLLLVSQNTSLYSEVWLSTGDGFTPALDGGGSAIKITNGTGALGAIVGAWLNDGATEFIMQDGNDTLYGFNYVPELMVSISNGIGATTTISYDRLNQNSTFYQKCPASSPDPYDCDTSPLNYPKQHVDGPIYVVKEVDASNGLGTCNPAVSLTNCYTTTYAYKEAQTDLSGRGFLGFGTVTISDPQTDIAQTTEYCTSFPLTGLVSLQTRFWNHTTTLSSVTNGYNNVAGCGATGTGGTVNTVNLTESVSISNDLDGSPFPTLTTDYTYDSYGNALTVDASASGGGGGTNNTTNTYYNSSGSWILGRLLTTSVNSVVGTSDQTRQSSFTYDTTTGLLTQENIEPGVSSCNSGASSCTLTTDYTYDAFAHRVVTTVSGSGIASRSSKASYDALGQFMISASNALGQTEFWSYDARFGTPVSHTGPNGQRTNWGYDIFGRMVQETRPDGAQTRTAYQYCGGGCPTYGQFYLQSQTLTPSGAQAGPVGTGYFDMLSRPIAGDTQGFDGSNIRVETIYDANERVHQTSRPYFSNGGTAEYTSFTHDDLGRVIQATFPDSSQASYAFNGLVTSVTNALSQTTTATKNAQGLIASVQDASSNSTSYVYDAFGDLVTVTDPAGNVVSNSYDIRGNKVASTDPDMGHWTYAYDVLGELTGQADAKGQGTTLTYDLLGQVLTRNEAGLYSSWTYGNSTGLTNIGKLTEAKTCQASNCTTVFTDRKFFYDTKSRPSQVVLHMGGNDYAYFNSYNPDNGQLAVTAYPSGLSVNHLYNQYGYLCRLTDYHHDAPTCGTAGTGTQIFATVTARDAELHLTGYTAGNGVATTQTFDAQTGLIQHQRAGPANALASFDYGFDTIGNLTARTDNDAPGGAYTEKFCYDSLSRLTNYRIGAACTGSGGKTAAYDSIGNITSKSDAGTYSYAASGAVLPHAVSAITGTVDGLTNPKYAYDGNGNMTCVYTGSSCTSATAGRLVSMTGFNMAASVTQGVTSLYMVYDDQHQRVTQVTTTTGASPPTLVTNYLNDPSSGAMSLHTVSGTVTATNWNSFNWLAALWYGTLPNNVGAWTDFITLDGQIIAQRDSTYSGTAAWGQAAWNGFNWGGGSTPMTWGTTHWNAAPWGGLGLVPTITISYFSLDYLGSVAVVANSGGSVMQRLSYDPWGKQRNPNGTDVACGTITSPTTRGFTNQEEMPTQCLVNLNARLYDPSIGKFMAADSIVPDPFDGQSFNRYAYVTNNPLSFTDPSGNLSCDQGDISCVRNYPFGDVSCIGVCPGTPEYDKTAGSNFLDWGSASANTSVNTNGATTASNNPATSSPAGAMTGGPSTEGNRKQLPSVANENSKVEEIDVSANKIYKWGKADQRQEDLYQAFNGTNGGLNNGVYNPGQDNGSLQNVANQTGGSVPIKNYHIIANQSGFDHVRVFHMYYPFPLTSRYAEQFRNPTGFNQILKATADLSVGGTIDPGGSIIFTADVGYVVGNDQFGNPTQLNTVVVQPIGPNTGELKTMYPGPP